MDASRFRFRRLIDWGAPTDLDPVDNIDPELLQALSAKGIRSERLPVSGILSNSSKPLDFDPNAPGGREELQAVAALNTWLKTDGGQLVAGRAVGLIETIIIGGAFIFVCGAIAGLGTAGVIVVVIGGTVLAVIALTKAASKRAFEGQNNLESIVGGALDVVGVSDVYADVTDKDIITHSHLWQEPFERGRRGGQGFGNILLAFSGKAAFKPGQQVGSKVRLVTQEQGAKLIARLKAASLEGGQRGQAFADAFVKEMARGSPLEPMGPHVTEYKPPSVTGPEPSLLERKLSEARANAAEGAATPKTAEPPAVEQPQQRNWRPQQQQQQQAKAPFYKIDDGSEIYGQLNRSGIVEYQIDAPKSSSVRGGALFSEMMKHFGASVKGVRGNWTYGDNLASFNAQIARGVAPEQAAMNTFTGHMAGKYGFSRVTIVNTTGTPGNYTKVDVLFEK